MEYQNEPERQNFLFCIKKQRAEWKQLPNRRIIINKEDNKVINNQIQTRKYNILNFFPKNLFYQFTQYQNVYFTGVGLLQMIPAITDTNGAPSIYMPLSFIIMVTMIKDIYEDFKRFRYDQEENYQQVEILNTQQDFQINFSQNILIGNVIKISKNQICPCDILILQSSNDNGQCYIETKCLDGESNLKYKFVHKEFLKYRNMTELVKDNITIQYERPNPYLYNFEGKIKKKEDKMGVNKDMMLNEKNIVLRGSILKETNFIIGVALYTGVDSKVMLNSVNNKQKKGKVERITNKFILLIGVFIICLCLGLSILNYYKEREFNLLINNDFSWPQQLFTNFGQWILVFTSIVPIALICSLELVKQFQTLVILFDHNLSYQIKDSFIFPKVQASNLVEQLGQVQHIFSDKTGTLTENVMRFQSIFINNQIYHNSPSLLKEVKSLIGEEQRLFQQTMLYLALCHSIIYDGKNTDCNFVSDSPDELALLEFAKQMDFVYIGKNKDEIINITNESKLHQYQLLNTLEFNSDRKRMSVIVQNQKTQQITLIIKGADNVIYQRLRNSNYNEKRLKQISSFVENQSIQGFRTLVVAYKNLEAKEYEKWLNKYNKIEEKTLRMNHMDLIESDLNLLAATSIEDKLQNNVQQTIDKIISIGIKFWILTGDKTETAINIGYSSGVIKKDYNILKLQSYTKQELENEIKDELQRVNESIFDYSLVINGEQLMIIQGEEKVQKILIELADKSRSVIACRISPKQKSDIVEMVRKNKQKNIQTLAIGDGANDVNMITAAHVGIGILGLEGSQAARASDFSIGQFEFLQRLLFFIGRESYRKNTTLIIFSFQKLVFICFPSLVLCIYNLVSPVTIYDSWLFESYSLLFCSLPLIIYAIFDQQFPSSTTTLSVLHQEPNYLETQPKYYKSGITNNILNTFTFCKFMSLGVLYAYIAFYLIFYQQQNTFQSNSYQYPLLLSGNQIFLLIVILSNIMIFQFTFMFNYVLIFSVLIGFINYFIAFHVLLDKSVMFSNFYLFYEQFLDINQYLSLALTLCVILTIQYFALKPILYLIPDSNQQQINPVSKKKSSKKINKQYSIINYTSEKEKEVEMQYTARNKQEMEARQSMDLQQINLE